MMKRIRVAVAMMGILAILVPPTCEAQGTPGTTTGTIPGGNGTGGNGVPGGSTGTPGGGGSTVFSSSFNTGVNTIFNSAATTVRTTPSITTFTPPTIFQGASITPVDQNQLNGAALKELVDGPPTVTLDEKFKQFTTILMPDIPVDVPNEPLATFEELAADLHKSAGQTYTPDDQPPTCTLNMADLPVNDFGGAHPTLVVQTDPNAHISRLRLMYQDPDTHEWVQVKGSGPNGMRVDDAAGSMEVDLDANSSPPTSQLTSCEPKPILIAASLDVASDALTSIPGYLMREVKHDEVFVLNKKSCGFYYASDPSLLSQGTLAQGMLTVCDTGALLGQNDNGVSVLNGRTFFMTGNQQFDLQTPSSKVVLPKDSSVLVEYNKAGGESKFSYLAQKDNTPAMVRTPVGRPLFVQPGKSLSVYQDLPVLKRLKLFSAAGNEVPMKVMVKRVENFDVQQVERTDSKKFNRVVQQRAQLPSEDPDRIVHEGRTTWLTTPLRVLAADDTIFSLDKGDVSLMIGEMYMHTAGPINFKTEVAQVKAKAQADFVVSYQTGSQRVNVLSGPGVVNVAINGHESPILPGEELFASARALSQKLLLPADGIARRKFNHDKVGPMNIATCDFSIPSILRASSYMKCIRQPRNPVDGMLRSRLLKTACAVTYATSSRGEYYAP